MNKYTITKKGKRGIDDLINTYAFVGGSQGDESATNSVEEYKASEGWLIFVFGPDVDRFDQKAINEESERRRKLNEAYVEELKIKGEYGKEYETKHSIHLKPNPLFEFDNPIRYGGIPLEGYRMFFVDDIDKP